MKEGFQRAAWRLDPHLMITSQESPLAHFRLPDFIERFYQDIKDHQAARGRTVQGGLFYGGAIGDIHRERRPKDYDLQIVIPDMVAAIKNAFAVKVEDQRAFRDHEEDIERQIGYDFPLALSDGIPVVKEHAMFGDYIEIPGTYHKTGEYCAIDLRVVSKPVDPIDFVSHFHAPVMAVALSLDDPKTFTYHRDYVDHTERKIMQVAQPVPERLMRKAARKGMTLIPVEP